jgi:uroporphyrinogen decarboxylase
MTNRFLDALALRPQTVPPVWMMRQAGRYQRAYQAFRKKYSFEKLCREPELSAKVALASVEDFDFDAAILFSDLLFPLDAMGLGLRYGDDGPRLAKRFTEETRKKMRPLRKALADLSFQAEAVAATRRQLPTDKGLIGFVGGPWTLFVYAVEGSHSGTLARAKSSMPLYRKFASVVTPMLEHMIRAQLQAGADMVMIFDTAAGELAPADFDRHVVGDLTRLAAAYPRRLGYFAKNLHPAHLESGALTSALWAGQGFDWRWNLAELLAAPIRTGVVQGNFDPALLTLTGPSLARAIDDFLTPIARLAPSDRLGWICGLGHGVLPGTPEASVKTFVRTVRRRLN